MIEVVDIYMKVEQLLISGAKFTNCLFLRFHIDNIVSYNIHLPYSIDQIVCMYILTFSVFDLTGIIFAVI